MQYKGKGVQTDKLNIMIQTYSATSYYSWALSSL